MRFDTGYHFSGGFTNVMAQMNRVLGIDDLVLARPIPNRIVLEESGNDLTFAAGCGHRGAEEELCRHFPKDAAALHKLMQTIRDLWYSNPGRDIAAAAPPQLELSRYNAMTVNEFNDSIGIGKAAAAAAGSFATCHGSLQCEASMSFHARVGFSLCDDLARPIGGGDTMINAFRREAAKLGISVRTGVKLRRFAEPDANGECRTAVLDDGTVLDADEVFFTIHPTAIAEVLPERALTASFVHRVRQLRDSTSFFCSYFTVDEGSAPEPGLVLYFAHNDLDSIMQGDGSQSAGYLIDRERDAEGKLRTTVAAFRPMAPGLPADAPATRAERAGDAKYQELKAQLAEDTAVVLARLYPELKNHLHFRHAAHLPRLRPADGQRLRGAPHLRAVADLRQTAGEKLLRRRAERARPRRDGDHADVVHGLPARRRRGDLREGHPRIGSGVAHSSKSRQSRVRVKGRTFASATLTCSGWVA